MSDLCNRRKALLAGVALAPLAACSTLTTNGVAVTIQQVIAAVNSLAANAVVMLNQMTAITPAPSWLTASLVTTVTGIVNQLNAAATQIEGVATVAAAEPTLQQIETMLNELVSVLAGFPLPAPISMALQMAAMALPFIEAAIGMVTGGTAVAHGLAAGTASHQIRTMLAPHAR